MATKKKAAKPKGSGKPKSPAVSPVEAKPQGAAKPGRPSDYTQEIADHFCELVAECKPVRRALEEMGNPVSWTTVKRWLAANEEFRAQYARAREDQADADADEIREFERRVVGPLQPGETALGHQEARLAIETRKWLAAKRKPKAYGSDLDLSDDDGTVTVQILRLSRTARVDK